MAEINDRTRDSRLPDDAYLAHHAGDKSIYFSPSKKLLYIISGSGKGYIKLGGQDLWRLLEIFEAAGSYALPPGSRPKTVILAEDDKNVQRLLPEEIRDAFGNRVQIYGFLDGNAAFNFFSSQADDIDLIVSCLIMPEMDGIRLLNLCKNLRPCTPYIIYTSLDYREDFGAWLADAYVVKNADTSEILSSIRKLLKLERHRGI